MAEHSQAITQLLDRAYRRKLIQTLANQSGVALGAALAGAVVLLLIGTQILDWYWLVILFAASFGFGVWRTYKSLPSQYALAQQIDHRLGLADAISTAYHYERSNRRAAERFKTAQLAAAESAARQVDLTTVFPFVAPRALYAAGGLALVAFGMFAIRYGVTRSLDFKPSLVRIAFDNFFQPDTRTADNKKSPWRQKLEQELEKLGISVNPTDAKQNELDPAANALTPTDSPEAANGNDADAAKSKASSVPNEKESGEPGGDEKSERAAGSDNKTGSDQQPEGNDGSPQNGQKAANPKGAKESQGQQNSSSLMDKMKDAMSNLMNKLKMNSKQSDQKQDAQNNSTGSQSQEKGQGEKGQMAGKQQSNGGEQQQDQQGQQESQGDPQQGAKAKSGDKNGDQKASQDSKSGIGKQDGDKSAREAEQLAAMGKISEILGKRAKDMSGEVMVEVSSGKQQLKTQYSSKNAAHAEAGGEISRDEVPLEYHEYVQQYFEQIRKVPAAATPAAKKPAVAPSAP